MQAPDELSTTGYSYSSGLLYMTHPTDSMLVFGDFYMDSRFGGYDTDTRSSSYQKHNGDTLTNGILEIRGDFTQLSSSTVHQYGSYTYYYPHENFQSAGEHQVILYGSAEFEDPESSFFNDPDG